MLLDLEAPQNLPSHITMGKLRQRGPSPSWNPEEAVSSGWDPVLSAPGPGSLRLTAVAVSGASGQFGSMGDPAWGRGGPLPFAPRVAGAQVSARGGTGSGASGRGRGVASVGEGGRPRMEGGGEGRAGKTRPWGLECRGELALRPRGCRGPSNPER